MKARPDKRRTQLDPVALLHSIRETQSALAAIVSPVVRATPTGESLERFLPSCPAGGGRMKRPHRDRRR